MSSTGSISENRIAIGVPPLVRDWLIYEARVLSITVPALVRMKLINLWDARQTVIREPDRAGRKAP